MKISTIITLIALLSTSIACLATEPERQPQPEPQDAPDVDMEIRSPSNDGLVLYGEPVKRVFAPDIYDFRPLDTRRLILYVTRSRPYLVTLRRRAPALNHTSVIGMKRRSSSIDARFDDIIIEGFPYPIERMEKLTPDTAKALLGIDVNDDSAEEQG